MKPTLIKDAHFEMVGHGVMPDKKRRITLGKGLLELAVSFNIYRNRLGQLILDPRKDISASEAWVFENPSVLASLKRGLQQSASGKARYLGSFAKHITEKDDEEA